MEKWSVKILQAIPLNTQQHENWIPQWYSLKPQELTNPDSFHEEFVDGLARCSLVDPLADLLVQSYIRGASEGQTYGLRLWFHSSKGRKTCWFQQGKDSISLSLPHMSNVWGVLSQLPLCSSGLSNFQCRVWDRGSNPGSRGSRATLSVQRRVASSPLPVVGVLSEPGLEWHGWYGWGEPSSWWYATAFITFHSASLPAHPCSLSAIAVGSVTNLLPEEFCYIPL